MDRSAREQAALIAAFRQGLGLAGLAIVRGPRRIRLAAVGADGVAPVAEGETGEVRFWCRHAADAERIVAAAKSNLQTNVDRALIAAAARLCVVLYSNEEIVGEAMATIARMEEELEKLRRGGALKSVNRSYRIYRQDSAARGEKIMPYAKWFGKYKENLARELAAALRYC